VVRQENQTEVLELAEQFGLQIKLMRVVANRGRNFGPLALLLEQGVFDGYEIVGHVHTKRTFSQDTDFTASWRAFLVSNLLGCDTHPNMMDRILSALIKEADIALVYPDDPLEIGWDKNEAFAKELVESLGMKSLPEHFKFPAGGMFWARTEYLRQLQSVGLKFDQMMPEPVPLDGSPLHALERLIGVMPEHFGFRQVVVRVPGIRRYLERQP
jgi:lipopolysaccharide biosynthesis protein